MRMKGNKLRYRAAALLLAALLLLGVMAPALASEGGADFEGDTILIHSAEELMELSRRCSLDTWSQGKTVILRSDLSLADTDFAPIPSFGGTFEGGGHTVSGLSVDGSVYPAGLFGIVQRDGVVRDLKVAGRVTPSGDADALGGVAGINQGTLTNCSFQGYVEGSSTVGGVVGLNETAGQLINCSFLGAVTGEHYVGGVAGRNLGSLIQCVNHGGVNTTEVDVDARLPGLEEPSLRSTEKVPAGTDIGGVAGFSTGLIQSCRNRGGVGYEHMGYNVGGIVGRQSGYLDGCVNTGTVRGRKDVGGIAGQMEPQVTLKYSEDTLSRLWDELDTLEALMDRTLSHAEGASGAISDSMSGLTDSVGTAKDAAVGLSDAMTDWANDNVEEINDVSARLSWALNQMEPITDDLSAALEKAETASGQFSQALDKAAAAGVLGGDAAAGLRLALDELRTASGHGRDAMDHIQTAMTHLKNSLGDTAKTAGALKELAAALSDLSGAFSRVAEAAANLGSALSGAGGADPSVLTQIQEELKVIADGLREMGKAARRGSEALNTLAEQFNASEMEKAWKELQAAADDLEEAADSADLAMGRLSDALKRLESAGNWGVAALEELRGASDTLGEAAGLLRQASEKAAEVIGALADRPAIRFRPIGSEVTERGDALDEALSQVLDKADALNETMTASSELLLADLREINRQMGVILDLLRQVGDQAKEEEVSDRFEDVSDRELSDDRTLGRVSGARNAGTVEGDINVAGIVGSVAIEYDFDPEDDLTESGDRSLDSRYQAVAVVRDSVNEGAVTAKKDCVGGIVGRLDLGTVYACQGYGSIRSTGGDYVGGIAGLSRSAVRRSFAKCTLSGDSHIGGILGAGGEDSVTQGCRSLVRVTDYEQHAGAISGSESGTFTENCFVSEELAGLGRVSYAGRAEPVSYPVLTAQEDLPAPFRSFTLSFVAEDTPLGMERFDFGASFDREVYPEIPQKEGCYARWDLQELTDLRFDTVVTAVYTPYITALSSEAVREDGRPVFYAEGAFQTGDRLEAQTLDTDAADFGAVPGPVFQDRAPVELWQLRLPEDGQAVRTLRYLPPEKEGRLWVYVRQDGAWRRVKGEEIGRYLAFPVEGVRAEVAVVSVTLARWVWLLLALPLLLLLPLRAVRRRGRSAR